MPSVVPPDPSPPVVAAALEVEAPAGCSGDASFRAALAAHGLVLSGDRPAWPAIHVRVEHAPEGADAWSGALRVERSASPGDLVEREVRGTRCADVEDALALVAALVLEDQAPAPPPPPPSPPPALEPDPAAADDVPAPRPARAHIARAGAQAIVAGLAAPSARPGIAAFGELLGTLAGSRASLRATFAYAGASVQVGPSELDLAWVTGRVDACAFESRRRRLRRDAVPRVGDRGARAVGEERPRRREPHAPLDRARGDRPGGRRAGAVLAARGAGGPLGAAGARRVRLRARDGARLPAPSRGPVGGGRPRVRFSVINGAPCGNPWTRP